MTVVKDRQNKRRNCVAILLFFGNSIVYAMRVNLSVAIVAMVGARKRTHQSTLISDDTCPVETFSTLVQQNVTLHTTGEFDWDEQTQGMVLGSFFWGYILTNLLGGLLAENFGGRLVYGMGVMLTALLTIISPLAARYSTPAFIYIRILEGMTEGVTFPALNVLMTRWVLPASRASFFSGVLSGCSFGTVVTMGVTGWLCETTYGWPATFYFFGGCGLLWCLLWFALVTDSPSDGCSEVPKENLKEVASKRYRKQAGVPWMHILRSPPFLCVVAAHTAANWGFYTLLTEMPSYLAHVMHFNVHTNGLVSSLPYVAKLLMLLAYPLWLDAAVSRGSLSLRSARRLSCVFGLLLPAFLLACIQWAGCSRGLVVLLLCLAVGVSAAETSGPLCAFQELAPNYAGTLTGISNTVATLPGFLSPQVAGYLTTDQSSRSSWRTVFLLSTALYVLGAAAYLSFMSVREQPWNSGEQLDRDKKDALVAPLLPAASSTAKA